MINTIIDSLLPYIQALNFADKVGGIVIPITRKIPNATDSGTTTETFPAYYNYNATNCILGDYLDMVPDSSKMTVIYFEDNGSTINSEDRHYYLIESRVKLVFWANLKNISSTLIDGTILAANIIDAIPHFLPNTGYCTKIQTEFVGMDEKSPAIFGAYSYDETRKQYLMYPFDYGALSYIIRWQLAKDCISDLRLNPDPCSP
jgi:hypothetical protein